MHKTEEYEELIETPNKTERDSKWKDEKTPQFDMKIFHPN